MTKADFLARAEARYEALQKLNSDELSFYAYEEQRGRLGRSESGNPALAGSLCAGFRSSTQPTRACG